MYKILIVEDSDEALLLIEKVLSDQVNLEVKTAKTLIKAYAIAAEEKFDSYIVDINIEGYSGIDFLKFLNKLYKNIDNQVIVISANSDINTKVQAFDLGASNYIQKPFDLRLLKAVIRKNLRVLDKSSTSLLEVGDITLNPLKFECKVASETDSSSDVYLTKTEFTILYRLLSVPDVVVSREELKLSGNSDNEELMSDKALEMHIVSLRKKHPYVAKHLKTRRGFGYLFSK